jgi:4-hydroxybenzoate polyprenyltransferase/phosphoserine phosphatase
MKPLCVDLDGTLIATDTLWESVLLLLRHNFLLGFLLPLWLIKGKAYLKHQIAQQITLDVATLPYRENVLAFLQREKDAGRLLVLATAAHQTIAQAVASHLKLFDHVIASDAHTNMKGTTKRDALKQRFGIFDYIGDSRADLPILQAADEAFFLGTPSASLRKQCKVFSVPKTNWLVWLKVLRPHQWVKNVLIFLPLFLAHEILDLDKLGDSFLAFIVFSLAASAGYVLNDLLDLQADRAHSSKKHRPFAAGLVPIQYGLPIFVVLISLSFLISLSSLPLFFSGIVGLYLLLTITYSFYIKHKLIIDVFVLASLYTLRILAGCIATTIPPSSWLLAFSMFIFISLAFLKRYIELLQQYDQKVLKNRSYEVGDIDLIATVGMTSGYLAILVFALYINTDKVAMLYHSPEILWMICPILLYWITRVWFLAKRRRVLDDPLQFALSDKISWLVLVCVLSFILFAEFF